MRNPVPLFPLLLLSVALVGPLAAQPAAPRPHPDVPAAFDVAGLHLVLNEEAQHLVQQKADGLCRHQPSFQARVDLADAAFPIIDRVLKQEGVPLDFRYLALQESALQGDARSVHEAVGYWQFKRETATSLGLIVSEAVDERQHLTASTRAAAHYLTRNNAGLHNWLNALLSYNTGLGGVKPYTLPTDAHATEMAITEATSPYVLMFLAQKLAFEPACGQNPKPPLRLQEFPAVAGQSLAAQAQQLHVEPANLLVHNHWLLAPVVPADQPYTLIVPVGDITQTAGIVANQRLQTSTELLTMPAVGANAAEVRLNSLRAIIALPGETTQDLARRGQQRLGDFLRNNELTGFDAAVTGRPYYLERKRDVAAVEYYVLQPGETLFDVAQKYGIYRKAILTKNRLLVADELRPGRVLWLQHVRPREVAVEYRPLPEGAGLERTAANPAPSSETTPPKTPRPTPGAADGWGEALPIREPAREPTSAPVVAPAPAPAAPHPVAASAAREATQLPPPAPAPAPAPLADEPRQPSPTAAVEPPAEPVASQSPVVVPVPIPTTGPAVAPVAAPVAAPAPLPAVGGLAKAVPAAPRPLAGVPKVAAVAAPAPSAASETTHRVEPHETVYSISRRYQLSPDALVALNHLPPPANLVVGQVLVLKSLEPLPAVGASAKAALVKAAPAVSVAPARRPNAGLYVPKTAAVAAAVPVAATAAQHTVAKGETLYGIARRYQVTVADLQAWNAKPDPAVKLGEVLQVRPSPK